MNIFRRSRRSAEAADIVEVPVSGPPAPLHPEPVWPEAELRCPQCAGTDLYWSLTCHTYSIGDGEKERWRTCLPCDSAIRYACADEECDWDYTHGLNPRNPRAEANERCRPPWLPAGLPHGEHGICVARPGIRMIGERHDD